MWYVLVLLAIALLYYVKNMDSRRKMLSNQFIGPKTNFLFGNAYEFLNIKPTEIMDKLHGYAKQYGRVYRLWFGNDFWLLFSDPKDCEVILTHPKFMNKSSDYDILVPWLGNGLLLNIGPSWYAHRKILTPAFHFSILENFVPVFEKQAIIFNGQIKKLLDEGVVDIDVSKMLGLLTLDIICETSMNVSINAQTEECDYEKNIKELTSLLMWRIFNSFAASDFIFKYFFWNKYRQQTLLIEKVHKFTNDIIEKKRKEIKAPVASEDNVGIKKRMALIDVLMQATIDGELLSNEAIRQELDSFAFAGHDTSSTALSFLLYNLAAHPEAQAKVYQEIVDLLPVGEPLTLSSLNNLKYVELVIKESMRIHTTVPNIGRQLYEETELNGKIIPANTNITVSMYFMCHDPLLFPDPEKFVPERFDVETNTEKSNPYAYIPFSAGSRNCIGQRFAMKEITAILVTILREFEVSVAKGFTPILTVSLVLKSNNGIHLQFKRR